MKHKKRASLVGPPKLWQNKRDCQIKFLLEHGLKQDHYLLDLGCGVLRGGIPLINYLEESHYYGIEKDPIRLEEGLKELEESNLTHKAPNLSTDYKNIDVKFDYIWSFQVLIHLSDKILEEVLFNIRNLLKDKGVCCATVAINKNPVNRSWREYPYVQRPLSFYEKKADKHNLSVNTVNYQSNNWKNMLEIRKKNF